MSDDLPTQSIYGHHGGLRGDTAPLSRRTGKSRSVVEANVTHRIAIAITIRPVEADALGASKKNGPAADSGDSVTFGGYTAIVATTGKKRWSRVPLFVGGLLHELMCRTCWSILALALSMVELRLFTAEASTNFA